MLTVADGGVGGVKIQKLADVKWVETLDKDYAFQDLKKYIFKTNIRLNIRQNFLKPDRNRNRILKPDVRSVPTDPSLYGIRICRYTRPFCPYKAIMRSLYVIYTAFLRNFTHFRMPTVCRQKIHEETSRLTAEASKVTYVTGRAPKQSTGSPESLPGR